MAGRPSGLGWPEPPRPAPSTGLGYPSEPTPAAAEPEPAPTPLARVAPGSVRTAADVLSSAQPDHGPSVRTEKTPIAQAAAAAVSVRGFGTGARLPRPPKPRLVVVANQKGGVGKTTTVVNLAAALALGGLSVLVVDLDPQGNASTALGIDRHADVPSVYDVLAGSAGLADVVRPVADLPGLMCAPATIGLAGVEIELVSVDRRESRLRDALTAYLDSRPEGGAPDYVFIDCPPSLGLLTVNGFVAAEEVLLPIQCEYYALEGVTQLLTNVDLVRAHLNPRLAIRTVLLTMYDARTRLASQVAAEVRAYFGDAVLPTAIPRSVRISEAPSYGQTVMTYDPASSGALSYLEATRELARRGAEASEGGEEHR